MKAKIICKTEEKDKLYFYAVINSKEYFLFTQSYKRSVKQFFKNGVSVNGINDYSSAHSTCVRRVLDKLPSYLHYIEKEYSVEIYNKTKVNKKQKAYKRESFRWQDYAFAV